MLPTALLLASSMALAAAAPIDRHALVTRHQIEWNDLRGQIPLGNGEFCFNADATGLQTFGGSTMSHWGWHAAPLPPGFTIADIPPTGTVEQGRIKGPMRKAAAQGELDGWMFRNPHPMNLGRFRLLRATGAALEANDAGNKNHYDARGVNTGGPCPYLPGNGGLLYAVAMMAAGWDGAPTNHAPGFPKDGNWVVRWEGLKRAL